MKGCQSLGARGMPQVFRNCRMFGNFNASSENFRMFAVSKDKGFEFYRKIIELGTLPPTLQVPRCSCTDVMNTDFFAITTVEFSHIYIVTCLFYLCHHSTIYSKD